MDVRMIRRWILVWLLLPVVLAGATGAAWAADPPVTDEVAQARERHRQEFDSWAEIIGTDAMGMGRAFRGVARGNNAIYYNPAGLIQGPYYYLDGVTEFNFTGGQKAFSSSVYDSDTNRWVNAALAFTYDSEQWTENNEKLLESDDADVRARFGKRHSINRFFGRVALAVPFFERSVGLGMGLRYMYIKRPHRRTINGVQMDIGLWGRFPFGLSLGATAYDLIPLHYDKTPRRFGWGAAYTAPFGLTLDYDMDADFDSGPRKGLLSHCAGIEYMISGAALRSGYTYDGFRKDHFWSVGLGYVGQQFAIQGAYQQGVVHPEDRLMSITIRGMFGSPDAGPGVENIPAPAPDTNWTVQ